MPAIEQMIHQQADDHDALIPDLRVPNMQLIADSFQFTLLMGIHLLHQQMKRTIGQIQAQAGDRKQDDNGQKPYQLHAAVIGVHAFLLGICQYTHRKG